MMPKKRLGRDYFDDIVDSIETLSDLGGEGGVDSESNIVGALTAFSLR